MSHPAPRSVARVAMLAYAASPSLGARTRRAPPPRDRRRAPRRRPLPSRRRLSLAARRGGSATCGPRTPPPAAGEQLPAGPGASRCWRYGVPGADDELERAGEPAGVSLEVDEHRLDRVPSEDCHEERGPGHDADGGVQLPDGRLLQGGDPLHMVGLHGIRLVHRLHRRVRGPGRPGVLLPALSAAAVRYPGEHTYMVRRASGERCRAPCSRFPQPMRCEPPRHATPTPLSRFAGGIPVSQRLR